MPSFTSTVPMLEYLQKEMETGSMQCGEIDVAAFPLNVGHTKSVICTKWGCVEALETLKGLSLKTLSLRNVFYKDGEHPLESPGADSLRLLFSLLTTPLWTEMAVFESQTTEMFDFRSWFTRIPDTHSVDRWEKMLIQNYEKTTGTGSEEREAQSGRKSQLAIRTTEEGMRLLTSPLKPPVQLIDRFMGLPEVVSACGLECVQQSERIQKLLLEYADITVDEETQGIVITATSGACVENSYEGASHQREFRKEDAPWLHQSWRSLRDEGRICDFVIGTQQVRDWMLARKERKRKHSD